MWAICSPLWLPFPDGLFPLKLWAKMNPFSLSCFVWYLFTATRKVTDTGNQCLEWSCCCKADESGSRTRNALEYCEKNFRGARGGNLDHQNGGGRQQKFSSWSFRGEQELYWELRQKSPLSNSGSFWPCSENLSEDKVEGNGLICFVKEDSRQLLLVCTMVTAHCCQSDA